MGRLGDLEAGMPCVLPMASGNVQALMLLCPRQTLATASSQMLLLPALLHCSPSSYAGQMPA